jgi:hypothetical protein
MTTIHHGTNENCPTVRAGQASRCPGHRVLNDLDRVREAWDKAAQQLTVAALKAGDMKDRSCEYNAWQIEASAEFIERAITEAAAIMREAFREEGK